MNVIEFKNVSYQREGMRSPLNSVDFAIKQGELVQLKGNNGEGKSTLIDFLLGIREPDSGEIKVFGESPNDLKHKFNTGTVIQKLKFPSNVTQLGKWINLIESHYPNAKQKVNSMIQKLEAKETETKKNSDQNNNNDATNLKSKFSGGEESKIFFALAQAGDPKLLILDEPTSNLSSENSQKIWQQIEQFIAEGKTVLFVCHDSEIGVQPDKTLVLENGKVTVIENQEKIGSQLESKQENIKDNKIGLIHWLSLLIEHTKFNIYQTLQLDKKYLTIFIISTILFAGVFSFLPKMLPLAPLGISHSFIIANAYSFYLALMAMTITGNTISIERQNETLTKILKTLPLPPIIYLSAKVIASLLILSVSIFLMIGMTVLISSIPTSELLTLSFGFIIGVIPYLFFGVALGYKFGQKEIQLVAIGSCFLFIIPIYLRSILEPFEGKLDASSSLIPWFNSGELLGDYLAAHSPLYHYSQIILYLSNETKYDQYISVHEFWLIWYIILALMFGLWAYKTTVKKEAKA